MPNYICVDAARFCLGDKVLACAKGTVCSTHYFLATGNSPCVWPYQA